jgi:hypothetical protein
MSADKRQRERRSRQAENIQTRPATEWTDSECLHVLAGRQWRGTALDAQAWAQLGKLREFVGKQP